MVRSEGDLLWNRFWGKVELVGECLIWTGAHRSGNPDSYGTLTAGGRSHSSHRFVYESVYGSLNPDEVVDHLCNTPACVNPAHLRACYQFENVHRSLGVAAHNARKTHCPRGHEYDRVVNRGKSRWCRKCGNEKSKQWAKANPEKRAEVTKAYRERLKQRVA